jgi:ABC-2 type transport system permease protein
VQNSFTIFRKEIASFFNSLVGYMVLIVFVILTGLFFWVFDEHILISGKANMNLLFQYAPIFFILLVPAITMRSISEEMKTGTIEFLVTKPLTNFQLIMGKFGAAAFLVFITILPTFIYYISIQTIARDPVGIAARVGSGTFGPINWRHHLYQQTRQWTHYWWLHWPVCARNHLCSAGHFEFGIE